MKKQIYISIIIFVFAFATILVLRSNETQVEKVTIQTGLHIVENFKMTGTIVGYRATNTKWVQDKNKKATSISFYADITTVNEIIRKLKSSIKNYPNKKSNHGKKAKLAWVVEKKDESTFIRLIHPTENNIKVNSKGC